MGLFDTLLGRTKPVKANLDALFALPSAAVTLQITSGLVSTKKAGVCFKPPAGQNFTDMQTELEKMLELKDDATTSPATAGTAPPTGGTVTGPGGPPVTGSPAAAATGSPPASTLTVRHVGDRFGYRWILLEGGDLDDLVTRVHMVHSSLEDAGWSAQLLVLGLRLRPRSGNRRHGGGRRDPDPSSSSIWPNRAPSTPSPPRATNSATPSSRCGYEVFSVPTFPSRQICSRWFPIWDLPVA